jgi:hypothetical protein
LIHEDADGVMPTFGRASEEPLFKLTKEEVRALLKMLENEFVSHNDD